MVDLTVRDVADYFLSLSSKELGDTISNLKLQKLVYYAQGFSLALHNKLLFDDELRAWQHGPVAPILYSEYKDNGADPIDCPKNINFKKYDNDVKGLLNSIYELFGQFSAWKLRDMTHEEPPWLEARKRGDGIIENEELKQYFLTQIEDE